ncbi:MAG: hypothetical protein Q9M18_08275 [Mariprofundaceae bacterium]|nr:hypothetical protein [Mariprofundaceae bacterium]
MSKKFYRAQRRKKRLRQIVVLASLCFILALGLVLVRSCSASMKSAYHDDYRPMDTHQLNSERLP